MRRDVFQAIADPTRRQILGLVAQQSMTPNTLAESFDTSRQAISKHIQHLVECGLLSVEVKGREYYYTIQPQQLAEVNDWLQSFRELWENRFRQLDDLLETMQAKQRQRKKKT